MREAADFEREWREGGPGVSKAWDRGFTQHCTAFFFPAEIPRTDMEQLFLFLDGRPLMSIYAWWQ